MDRYTKSGGVDVAPSAPAAADHPYYTAGDAQNNIPATRPGPWLFHMITEELRNVVLDGGLTPAHNVLTQVRDAIRAMIAAANSGGLRGYIDGLSLSTAGSSASFSISAGLATSSDNTTVMTLAASLTKTTSAWVVGNNQGGLDTGVIANNTWYHVHEIKRMDTGVVDALISLSATAPTLPANYTKSRRLGSMKTNGSGQWVKFIQNGDEFFWDTPVQDANATNGAASLLTVSVPTGVKVKAYMGLTALCSPNSISAVFLHDPSIADVTAGSSAGISVGCGSATNVTGTSQASGEGYAWTNTSGQVRYNSNGVGSYVAHTKGWIDQRGRNS